MEDDDADGHVGVEVGRHGPHRVVRVAARVEADGAANLGGVQVPRAAAAPQAEAHGADALEVEHLHRLQLLLAAQQVRSLGGARGRDGRFHCPRSLGCVARKEEEQSNGKAPKHAKPST